MSDTVGQLVGLNPTDLKCLDLLALAGPTTAGQLADAVKEAEARRAALIGTISLTVVGDEPSRH